MERKWLAGMWLGVLAIALGVFTMMPDVEAADVWGLKAREGKWYDHDTGKLILEIKDGKINGLPVLRGEYAGGASASNGSANYLVNDNGKNVVLNLTIGMTGGLHKCMAVNQEITLFSTPKPQYYESVNGVYLGMTEKALLKVWGKPTRKMNHRWYYKKQGVVVRFDSGAIDRIELLKESPLSFDKSGLNCSSLDEEFEAFYGFSSSYNFWPYNNNDTDIRTYIGQGEYMFSGETWLKRASIILTIYGM